MDLAALTHAQRAGLNNLLARNRAWTRLLVLPNLHTERRINRLLETGAITPDMIRASAARIGAGTGEAHRLFFMPRLDEERKRPIAVGALRRLAQTYQDRPHDERGDFLRAAAARIGYSPRHLRRWIEAYLKGAPA